MISEKKFAAEYSAFWQQLLPMSEYVVRRLNLSHVQRFARPMTLQAPADRRGLINELAFFCFRYMHAGGKTSVGRAAFLDLEEKARKRIAFLDGLSLRRVTALKKTERAEVTELADRTLQFFPKKVRSAASFVVSPRFRGCGIIDRCEGDVFTGRTLVEIKAGDRQFRSVDFRQLFVYGALSHAASTFTIEKIALLNPRHGTFLGLSADAAAREFAGVRATQMYEEIIQYVSSGGVSK